MMNEDDEYHTDIYSRTSMVYSSNLVVIAAHELC